MGSQIELNDTLKISKERGFPKELNFENHQKHPEKSWEKIKDKIFEFWNSGERLYNRPPTRVFLVEEIGEKWLYWGHAFIIEQAITKGNTKGRYKIIKLYDPEYQIMATKNEAPEGKSYI
ncbi:MAG: hypothetical protein QW625_00200 [Candidatus Nanoarchaeia archaeon]